MRAIVFAMFILPALAVAGTHDYYECRGADGELALSVEPCPRGDRQRRIADDTAPTAEKLPAVDPLVQLQSSAFGHFRAIVQVNGVPLRAVVDTGASFVALTSSAARKARVDLTYAKPSMSATANGLVKTLLVTLPRVELRGNLVRNVPGNVLLLETGDDWDILLGMSFLRHFDTRTEGNVMSLRRR